MPQQGRHRCLERIGCQIPDDLKPVLKSYLLDLDVHPEEVDLLPQGNDLMTGVIE
jgi:hypothetical protein